MNIKNKPQLTSVLHTSNSVLNFILTRIDMCEIDDSNIDDFITDIPNNVNYDDLLIDVMFRVDHDESSECLTLKDYAMIFAYIKDGDNGDKPLAVLLVEKDRFTFNEEEVIKYYLDTAESGRQYHHHLNIQVNSSVSLLQDMYNFGCV